MVVLAKKGCTNRALEEIKNTLFKEGIDSKINSKCVFIMIKLMK